MSTVLPPWAKEMRDLFRSGSCAQFLLHGNVFDVVPAGGRLFSLKDFLEEVMFAGYDVVLQYDRSRGVRATLSVTDDTIAYQMTQGAETIYVLVNRGDSPATLTGLPDGAWALTHVDVVPMTDTSAIR